MASDARHLHHEGTAPPVECGTAEHLKNTNATHDRIELREDGSLRANRPLAGDFDHRGLHVRDHANDHGALETMMNHADSLNFTA